MSNTIMRGAEPIFYRGNETGCLCLHGFMASPNEVRWLGDSFAEEGYTVYCPRIAGHGVDPKLAVYTRWEEYFASVLDGYHLLRQQCDRVFVFGMSMGGTLGLLLASQMELNGVGVMASPIQFLSRRLKYAHQLRYLYPFSYQPTPDSINEKVKAEQQRRGEPIVGRVRYEHWPTAALAQLYQLTNYTYQQLPLVKTPLLLIYSEKDPTVPVSDGELISEKVSSQHIQKHILKESGHILTQDTERDTVFELSRQFVHQF